MPEPKQSEKEVQGDVGVRIVDSISMSIAGDRAAMQAYAIKNMDRDGDTRPVVNVKGYIVSFDDKEFTNRKPKEGEPATRKTVAMAGKFEAINLITGEHHVSGMLYLNDNVVAFIRGSAVECGLPMDIEVMIEVMRWKAAGTGYKQSCRLISAKAHPIERKTA